MGPSTIHSENSENKICFSSLQIYYVDPDEKKIVSVKFHASAPVRKQESLSDVSSEFINGESLIARTAY